MDIKTLIRKEVLAQPGYRVDTTLCRIKMDAMENPFTIPPPLKKKLLEEMRKVSLNRYPEPGAPVLRKRFAQHYGVDTNMIMIGNGSDELIQTLCSALIDSSSTVMVPLPTFVMYRIIAINTGHMVIEVPLDETYDLDLDATLKQITKKSPVLIFLSYPNNPTGNCFSIKKITTIIEKSKGIVVVDEAYGSFSGKTLIPLLKKYDNLVILKTLSKVGLAGIRIGFLIGSPSLIHELDKVRLPYNINALSQVAAGFYLDHMDIFVGQTKEIIQRREELLNKLKKVNGIKPYSSQANFIFFSCDFDTDSVYEKLIKEGVLIKNLNSPGVLKNCMRVTVGTREENSEFLKALKKVLLK
ncbi:MAG TPA: histidinol-phosphate transaminase [Syntrophales bacterium]|nr:histidinol-phosphate transaminase [Syntrophales bacterium]